MIYTVGINITQNQSEKVKKIMQVRFVAIEGNIGSGKSTVLKRLKCDLETEGHVVFLIDEPVDTWQGCVDVDGHSKFEAFYKDRKLHAFSFQLHVQMTRLVEVNKAIERALQYSGDCPVVILSERSLQSGNRVFGQQLVAQGFLSRVENEHISSLCDELLFHMPQANPVPLVAGYHVAVLDTLPEVCRSRSIRRDRKNEALPDGLLEELDTYHKQMVEAWKRGEFRFCPGSINGGPEELVVVSGLDSVSSISTKIIEQFDLKK